MGAPKSWSWYPQYKNVQEQRIRNSNYRLVQPWFDEPPLFSLMMGVYGRVKGVYRYEDADAGVFRWPMIKFAALNTFLLFLILYMLKKPIVGLAASAIYATAPTMVMGSRLPISDNMVGTFALLSIVLLLLYEKSRSKISLIVLVVFSSLAILLKSTGVFVPMGILFVFLGLKDYKAALFQILGLIIVFGMWLGYGFYYNWDTFLAIAKVSSGRELFQPGNLISLFLVYRIGESAASVDGWLLWGWLSAFAYSFFFVNDKNKPLLERLILPSFLPSIFFLGVPLASSYIFGTGEYKFTNLQIRQFQYLFVLVSGIFMGNEINLHPKFLRASQILIVTAFIVAIIFNFRTIMFFQDQFWYQ